MWLKKDFPCVKQNFKISLMSLPPGVSLMIMSCYTEKDVTDVGKITKELAIKQRNYSGGANLITWPLWKQKVFSLLAEDEVREIWNTRIYHAVAVLKMERAYKKKCRWHLETKSRSWLTARRGTGTSVLKWQETEFSQQPK